MKPPRPGLTLLALALIAFCLALKLDAWNPDRHTGQGRTGGLLVVLFGDGRRLFANHFFAKADAYYHRGVYPGIFETAHQEELHMVSDGEEAHHEGETPEEHAAHATTNAATGSPTQGDDHNHDAETAPADWIAWLNSQFRPTAHVHLGSADAREMLPWLRLAAELDPQRVQTYVVTAFWLAQRLGRVDEAERFLRDGLRANPNHPELLFELAELHRVKRNDPARARNLLELADAAWIRLYAHDPRPDRLLAEQILTRLGLLALQAGQADQALSYFNRAGTYAANPEALQSWIEEARQHQSH